MTLIETMLVLVIAGGIIAFGIKQSRMMARDNEVREIRASVDQLFQGMATYYQANCRDTRDANGNIISRTGSLDPNDTTPPPVNGSMILPIATGTTSLVSRGYITKWSPIYSGIIDNAYGDQGYSVQFDGAVITNGHIPTSLFYNWAGDSASGHPLRVTLPQNAGTYYLWLSHVAVKLSSTSDPVMYKGRLGASCISSDPTSTCATASSATCLVAGPSCYLIWQSLPSTSSPSTITPLAPSMGRVKAFTNLYNTDDLYGATNSNWTPNNNYLCGG
jgi:type II secretory pathway pseudopilin PulG